MFWNCCIRFSECATAADSLISYWFPWCMVVLNLGQYDASLSLLIIITKLSDVQKNYFIFEPQFPKLEQNLRFRFAQNTLWNSNLYNWFWIRQFLEVCIFYQLGNKFPSLQNLTAKYYTQTPLICPILSKCNVNVIKPVYTHVRQ